MEEITGKWRIQKCKGSSKEGSRKRARSLRPRSGYDNRERGCDCGAAALKPSKMDRRSHRQLSSGQREYAHYCKCRNEYVQRLKACFLYIIIYALK